jgi:hypothetical protein
LLWTVAQCFIIFKSHQSVSAAAALKNCSCKILFQVT